MDCNTAFCEGSVAVCPEHCRRKSWEFLLSAIRSAIERRRMKLDSEQLGISEITPTVGFQNLREAMAWSIIAPGIKGSRAIGSFVETLRFGVIWRNVG